MIKAVNIQNSEGYYKAFYRLTETGDCLVVSPSTPVLGVTAVTNVSIDENHTGTDTFDVACRFSVDGGLNWSVWADISSLYEAHPLRNHWFAVEFSVTKVGSQGNSYFGGVELEFDGEPLQVPDFYKKRIKTENKSDYYNHESIAWALNVLNKVYHRGIVPSYITRSDNKDWADEDYINLWWSIIYPIALRITMVNEFTDLLWHPALLKSFLEQRGLILGTNPSFGELYYLMSNFYDEVLKRGTFAQLDLEREVGDTTIRGEFARLIDLQSAEDLFVAIINPWELGWWLGKTSICDYVNTDHIADYKLPMKNGKVDVFPNQSYLVKVKANVNMESIAYFGASAYDDLSRTFSFLDSEGNETNEFFSGSVREGDFVFMGVIRPNNKPSSLKVDGISSSLRFGQNSPISKIVPYLNCDGGVEVESIEVYRLDDVTTYLDFVVKKFLSVTLKNHNPQYSDEAIQKIFEEKFLPLGMEYRIMFNE